MRLGTDFCINLDNNNAIICGSPGVYTQLLVIEIYTRADKLYINTENDLCFWNINRISWSIWFD